MYILIGELKKRGPIKKGLTGVTEGGGDMKVVQQCQSVVMFLTSAERPVQ